MYIIHALYNEVADRIYIGQTNDLQRRWDEHNVYHSKHYTGRLKGEWKLVYKEEVSTRSEAIKREKQLKSFRGREYIKTYIPG